MTLRPSQRRPGICSHPQWHEPWEASSSRPAHRSACSRLGPLLFLPSLPTPRQAPPPSGPMRRPFCPRLLSSLPRTPPRGWMRWPAGRRLEIWRWPSLSARERDRAHSKLSSAQTQGLGLNDFLVRSRERLFSAASFLAEGKDRLLLHNV